MISSAKRCFVGEREKTPPPTVGHLEPTAQPSEVRSAFFYPSRVDPLAGVPGRAEAEGILAAAMREGRPIFATVFVVDRVHLLNDCFGYALGDKLLLGFHEQLTSHFQEGDRICRWSGTSFVALLGRLDSLDEVQAEVARVACADAQITVRLGDGALILTTAADWAVFPVHGASSIESLVCSIDHYVAGSLGR